MCITVWQDRVMAHSHQCRYSLPQRQLAALSVAQAQKRLPTMSAVARKFLGVTATSVASERVFSKTGYIVSDRRALLKPSKV